MTKKKLLVFFLLLVIIVLFFVFLSNDSFWKFSDNRVYEISVIIRGKNSESWAIMKQGIDQAASEKNVDISFVTLTTENSVDEQVSLLKREIDNGADAILISPVDEKELVAPIENAMKKLPVIMIESTVSSDKAVSYISCDNNQLGIDLADELYQYNSYVKRKVTVVESSMQCSSVQQRYQGFLDEINKISDFTLEFQEFSAEPEEAYEQAKAYLASGNGDIIVAFEPTILEELGQASKDLKGVSSQYLPAQIYGVGNTTRIVSLMEEKYIHSTAVQNDFNIGYLGVQTAVDAVNGHHGKSNVIDSTVVNIKNMYTKENQRLLFPFIR